MKLSIGRWAYCCLPMLLSPSIAAAQDLGAPSAGAADVNEIVVVGSRSLRVRSALETPAPVDLVGAEQLTRTGQVEVSQMLNFVAPSFNSAKQTIANGTDHIDP